LEASTARDFLLFNCRDDRREVLEVAHLLRSQGYTAARDIIRREHDSSLEYARRMNIRCMLIVGDDSVSSGCVAVRVRDGHRIPVSKEQLQQNGLMKYIEESQGDE
jgi:ATP phosphoribosyltransferase regulatory subunit